ncbi:MAG: hypothetical protein ABI837_11200 [Acidobacteriota bacterium]
MRRSFLAVLTLSLGLLAAAPASAFNTGGTTLIFPIIGRFPGANGSQWRTDVFIASHSSLTNSPMLTFYVAGGVPLTATVTLSTYSSVSLPDIVLTTFGLANASGQLQIVSSNNSNIEARARIYNAGNPAGEFAQGGPAIGRDLLSSQVFLYGLSGVNGNRVNVGLANPNDTAVAGTIRITDDKNGALGTSTVTLAPHETQQFNDIFARFGIAPQAGVQFEFNGNGPVYGYSSEVRNDTGDAVFVFGTSPNG